MACAYAAELDVKMADEEAERERGGARGGASPGARALSARLEALRGGLRESGDSATPRYCRAFCQMLVDYVSEWRSDEDPWPVLEGYAVALHSYARASTHLSPNCENAHAVLERLSLSCVELLLSLPTAFPDASWEQFRSTIQMAHLLLQENGISQLRILSTLTQDKGIWTDSTLQSILSNQMLHMETVHAFLAREGPEVLHMRVKYLIKENLMDRAALLAKACASFPEFDGKVANFRQIYLVCLCTVASQQTLMDELSKVDCRDALEMICNLESEGDEKGAFTLCSGFLSRQLLQEDTYCAWELTLFWSKLLKRLEPTEQGFLERCRQMSLLAKTVFHLLFFIKVIQSEFDKSGLPTCIEMCIRALRMESCEGANKTTVCKTISCLLPTDLEVKRACQLTEFLLEPTVDSYYAVETLYNEPDQKMEEESLPIPNSLRCDLLLVFKTQWPFDPEFWDWKTLKRHCLGLMGEEASIVSSIDELNDERPEETDQEDSGFVQEAFKDVSECFLDATNELKEIADQKQKNREIKKLREKGFVSARFRNWQAYMQYCVLCDKEFLGHRIVRHAQTHFKDGYYSCPICAETFETRENLDPHVASHVKLSCKERLAAMKTTRKLVNAKTGAPEIAALKVKSGESPLKKTKAKSNSDGDSERLYSGEGLGSPMDIAGLRVDGKESNICPVPNCRKGFKYFRNLLAHVKDHGDVEEAKRFLEMQSTKIVCQYCRRQFVSVNHLNDHLQVHCGTKPYICIQLNCKASFDSNAELLIHRKDHPVFKAKCMFPGCGKVFSEAFKLYDHEAQHYKTFTCKVPGCGKVFHTQSQLDEHEESHNVKVEPQDPENQSALAEPLPVQPSQPATEDVENNNLTSLPLKPQCSLSPLNNPASLVKVKHSIESMLNPTAQCPTQAFDPGTCKTEPPDPYFTQHQIPPLEKQVTQPTTNPPMPQLNEPQQPEESLLDALLNDPMLPPPCPLPPNSSYQSILEDFHDPTPSRDALQGQIQTDISQNHSLPPYNNQYHQNPVSQVQAQYQDPYGNNTTALTHSSHNGTQVMPVSQRLPPQVTTFPSNGQVSESRPVQPLPSNTAVPATEEKERHKCAYETCPRDYSSYRSLTKHMKAVHPEFYAEWKLARKNNKILQTTSRLVSASGNLNSSVPLQTQLGQRTPAPVMQMQTPAGHSAYAATCSSSSYPVSSHLAAPESQPFHNQMDNILNPIVLSQLGNDAEPSHLASQPSWNSVAMNSSHPHASHSQAVTQNMDVVSSAHYASHVNAPSQGQRADAQHGGVVYPSLPPQNNAPCHFTPSQTGGMQRMNNPTMPGHPSNTSASCYAQQPKSNSVPVVRHTECVVKQERKPDLPPSDASEQNTPQTVVTSQASQEDDGSSALESDLKRVKRNKRTKWPAIVRDGKFICCRCFREFQSPKSLGGHLSKRSHCKEYDETDLTADLPTSFLDLLNSPHPIVSSQTTPSAHMNSNQPFHSIKKGPLNPKLFPNVTFLHANDSTCTSNGKQQSEIVKHGSPGLCEQVSVGVGQQTYTDSSLSICQDGQNSVIQHTGNVKEKNSQVNCTQTCNPSLSDSSLSDHLLTRLLGENNPSTSYNRQPTDPISKLLQTETLNKMKEIKERSTIVNASGLSNDGLLAAMASLAQNLVSEKSVKEKLREQILAGDFQKRNSLCQAQSPVGVQQTSHVIQRTPQSDQCPVGSNSELSVERLALAARVVPDDGSTQPAVLSCDPVDNVENDKITGKQEEDEITEIEKALQKLDLHNETSEDDQPNTQSSVSNRAAKTSDVGVSNAEIPGYACDSDGCSYRAMTKDALFKHLVKLHNYTEDMLNQCRKDQSNLAPFSCQVCSKTFTRNSNLRAHYHTAHNYSLEQIVRMKVARHYSRRPSEGVGSTCPTPNLLSPQDSPGTKTVSADGQLQRGYGSGTPDPITADQIKSENHLQPFVQHSTLVPLNSGAPGAFQPSTQAVQPSVIKSGPSLVTSISTEPQLNGHIVARPFAPSPHTHGMPRGTPHVAQTPSGPAQTGNLSMDKKPKLGRPKMPKPREVTKKPKEKKPELEDVFSPYRPYRCVHQGCVAAFTIQHNLILHYKAVHQSALPKFEVNDEEEQNEEEENEDGDELDIPPEACDVSEFLCQVKDCSRIFQKVTDLLQHYLQLHKLSLDRAGAMVSSMNLGRFQCDQADCCVTFTAFWDYVSHINNEHKDAKISKVEPVEGTFRCEVEGCDCTYSTRSNLLRHTMKKHQDLYRLQLMNSKESERGVKLGRPRKNTYACLEKENREINKKPLQKPGKKRKEGKNNYWTKYGKPILKTKEEASALCTKRMPLQYPCMIKGCERVTGSERNLMKHYLQHGLLKQYLEEQRSNYIYCKKLPRSRYKRIMSRSDDTDKSEESSIEMSENEETVDTADTGPSESEFSKPTSEKESTEDAEISDAKPSTDTGSDISVVVKRRRGRPRKGEGARDKAFTQKRVTRLRAAQSYSINYADINSDSTSSSATLMQEEASLQSATLSSFKPMGFEVSFLQFLEESNQSSGKRKASGMLDVNPRKRSSVMCNRSDAGDILKLVEFKNPQKLTSLTNVTFEVHRGFSNVFELLLKQLHDMRPLVVIQRRGCI